MARVPLPLAARRTLWSKTASCTSLADARKTWDGFRGSASAEPLLKALQEMAGGTQRCFYCGDSRGAEVEHFSPLALDVTATFAWPNLLLVCGPCNRQKSRARTWDGGTRLFLDPTLDDPWDHLILVTTSGLVTARYLLDGSVDELGRYTLEKLSVLNHDAITDARRRVVRRLNTAIDQVATTGDTAENRRAVLHAVDDDFFGVARWFALREGRDEERYLQVRTQSPALWHRFCVVAVRE